jgi:hypothetical protein
VAKSLEHQLLIVLDGVLEDQVGRWREVLIETGDERVEALARDAIRELDGLQDAALVGHLQDALDV